eukprot:5229142-Pyramimonas_sp.AAC.1
MRGDSAQADKMFGKKLVEFEKVVSDSVRVVAPSLPTTFNVASTIHGYMRTRPRNASEFRPM